MEPQDLQKLIEELEKSTGENQAYAGFFIHDKHDEDAYLKANKKGLEMTAASFLRAILDFENAKEKKEEIYIELNSKKPWYDKDSHLSINFIEIVDTKPDSTQIHVPKWYDPLPGYGCIATIIVILIAAIIGFIEISKWLLN